jgi:photosystem I P700 chlorophyll a apoprotein A2
MWVSGNLFHIGWNGNYELWKQNPIGTLPIAGSIWDPHFGSSGSGQHMNIAYNGIYALLYTLGFNSVSHLYNLVIATELLAVISILLAFSNAIHLDSLAQWVRHHSPISLQLVSTSFSQGQGKVYNGIGTGIMRLLEERLNFHTYGAGIGFLSIAWAGHFLHLCGIHSNLDPFQVTNTLSLPVLLTKRGSRLLKGSLGFHGGLKPDTMSLYLTDIAHHHLAVGILFVLSAHVYSSLYKGFGHGVRDVLFVNGNSSTMISALNKSLHLNLSLACAGLAVITSVVAQHTYSLTPYFYLSYDYVTTVALYCNHQYIASLLMMAALVHACLFLIRDYTVAKMGQLPLSTQAYAMPEDAIGRILKTKAQLISHLSWVCLYLGFHTLGSYIHNDTVVAFGEPALQIASIPVFASILQESSSNIMPLGPGDLLAHHAIALGLHVTVLILLKGSTDARGSRLMPDKIHFALSFACDGPTRGGTCDISAWDSAYLAFFWMLNTDAWIMFYFHWRQQCAEDGPPASSTYLNGWFRDYLWQNSASLVNGYNAFGANDLSVLSWVFLGAHLCWSTGFMFLISWRGYWQELIDIILVMHLKTPVLYDLWNGGVTAKGRVGGGPSSIVTPVALSIVQARFGGVVHFSTGFILTYPAFSIGATS